MYYYLNAALEHHRGHGKQAEAWLAQGDAHYTRRASEQVFAESFRSLGWYTERSERLIAAARRRDATSITPASVAVVELIPGQTPVAHPAETPVKNSVAPSCRPPRRLPAQTGLPHHGSARASHLPGGSGAAAQMPPPDVDLNDLPDNGPADHRARSPPQDTAAR